METKRIFSGAIAMVLFSVFLVLLAFPSTGNATGGGTVGGTQCTANNNGRSELKFYIRTLESNPDPDKIYLFRIILLYAPSSGSSGYWLSRDFWLNYRSGITRDSWTLTNSYTTPTDNYMCLSKIAVYSYWQKGGTTESTQYKVIKVPDDKKETHYIGQVCKIFYHVRDGEDYLDVRTHCGFSPSK